MRACCWSPHATKTIAAMTAHAREKTRPLGITRLLLHPLVNALKLLTGKMKTTLQADTPPKKHTLKSAVVNSYSGLCGCQVRPAELSGVLEGLA